MNKALNEIGKLRNEMKVGFIELANQMRAGNESLQNQIKSLQKEMRRSVESTIRTLDKFSQNVEAGFIAVEDALDKDLTEIRTENGQIKKRLDDANI